MPVCVNAVRIVVPDKLLCYRNTLLIIIIIQPFKQPYSLAAWNRLIVYELQSGKKKRKKIQLDDSFQDNLRRGTAAPSATVCLQVLSDRLSHNRASSASEQQSLTHCAVDRPLQLSVTTAGHYNLWTFQEKVNTTEALNDWLTIIFQSRNKSDVWHTHTHIMYTRTHTRHVYTHDSYHSIHNHT